MKLSLSPKGSASRYLGVDIGYDNIKVAEVEVSRTGAHVVQVGMIPTPLHAVAEGQIVMPELVAQALRELIKSRGIAAREAIGSVTGSSVFVRPIGVPRQKPADLALSIIYEAQKWVSTTPEESYFETCMLPEPPGSEENLEMAVLLGVAPRTLVDSRVVAMEMAGLEPMSVDMNALAAIRALINPAAFEAIDSPAPTVAIVDMGASYTDVTIVQGYIPVFSRTINIGGTSFTNALAGVMGVEFEEAQAIKHHLNADSTDPSGQDATAGRVVQSLLEELIRDVRRSIAYHASTLGWESIEGLVDRIILIGGGSRLIHAEDYFANVLQIHVESGNLPLGGPISLSPRVKTEVEDTLPSYLIAIGLAAWPLFHSSK